MRKPFQVREYDTIISENENITTEYYKQMDRLIFEKLQEFLQSFVPEDDSSDALDFMKISYKRGVGTTIQMKNYVGVIQMQNGYQIQILPKITFHDGSQGRAKDQTKEIFLKMLRSMKDFPCKVFHTSNVKVDRMNLYEIFINMYVQEVRALSKKGLKSAYILQEDNLRFYKGKMLISQQIKKNAAHKERFYVSYDEYQINRPENRLIKSTLLKLQKLSNNAANLKEIRQLLTYFELVEPSVHYQKDFDSVVLDRNTRDYENAIKWSKVFLMNKSFTAFSGETASRALLFPMEKVFEAYVADHMKKIMKGTEWTVSTQDKGHYLFQTPRKQFALRPDIVIERPGQPPIILDTKWKRLTNEPRKNYGISQADMYQMYAYSKKYHIPDIWLLYPQTEELKEPSDIVFGSEDGVTVRVFFVDVGDIEGSLKAIRRKMEMGIV